MNKPSKPFIPPVPVLPTVSGKAKQQVIDYLNRFPKEKYSDLINDFNEKIQSYLGDEFLKNVHSEVLKNPDLAKVLESSSEPNWRGYFGFKLKDKPEHPFDRAVAQKYLLLYSRAQSKGLDFDLELSDIRRMMKRKTCFYTKVVMTDDEGTKSTHRTFDRIDNTKGYTKDNVIVCCLQINQIKSNLFESTSSPTFIDPLMLQRFVNTYVDVTKGK